MDRRGKKKGFGESIERFFSIDASSIDRAENGIVDLRELLANSIFLLILVIGVIPLGFIVYRALAAGHWSLVFWPLAFYATMLWAFTYEEPSSVEFHLRSR